MHFHPHSAANFKVAAKCKNKFPVWERGSLFNAILQISNIRVGVPMFPFLAAFTVWTEEMEEEGRKGGRKEKREL